MTLANPTEVNMIFNEERRRVTDEVYENLQQHQIKEKIENATVLLKYSNFTGSGVILLKNNDKKEMWIASAAHNILLSAKGANVVATQPKDWQPADKKTNTDKILSFFKDNVKIHYRACDDTEAMQNAQGLKAVNKNGLSIDDSLPEPKAVNARVDINEVKLNKDWDTDLCLIRVKYTDKTFPRGALFSCNDIEELSAPFAEQQNFHHLLSTNINAGRTVANINKYQFIQAGFGRKTREDNGTYTGNLTDFQSRVVEFDKSNIGPFEIEDGHIVDDYKEVYIFDSDDENTSLPGDSGGPVFGVILGEAEPHLYLVALTLGSEGFVEGDAPIDADTVMDGHYNNTATSAYNVFDAEKYK